MISKKYYLITVNIIFFMIFFMNSSDANYKRLFFDYSINNINGKEIKLSEYKENVILVVNVASYCGFTKQYEDLQNLWEK